MTAAPINFPLQCGHIRRESGLKKPRIPTGVGPGFHPRRPEKSTQGGNQFPLESPIGTKLPTAVHALGVYTAADGVTALPKPGVRNSLETSVVTTERTPSEALKLKLEEKKNNTAVRDGLNRPWPS